MLNVAKDTEVGGSGLGLIAEQVMSPKAKHSEDMMRRRRSEMEASEESKPSNSATSTRASGAKHGADLALVPVSKERVGGMSPEGRKGEVEQSQAEVEVLPPPPQGSLNSLVPKTFNLCSMKHS